MKKQELKTTQYILEDKDISTIRECLNYCYHRLNRQQCGAPIELEEVQRLRRELGIPMKKEKYYKIPSDFYRILELDIEV